MRLLRQDLDNCKVYTEGLIRGESPSLTCPLMHVVLENGVWKIGQ